MLKNRDITVSIGKKVSEDENADGPKIEKPLEEKVRRIVHVLEEPAKKVFVAVCIYVVLDTIRQVEIAKASNPSR